MLQITKTILQPSHMYYIVSRMFKEEKKIVSKKLSQIYKIMTCKALTVVGTAIDYLLRYLAFWFCSYP